MLTLTFATILSVPGIAATKDSGTTTLKDVQPAGTTNNKQKHQQYDLSFASASGKEYTCRTGEKTSVKATDFVVGSSVTYEVKDNKGKLKTAAGKQLSCTIVRVAIAPTGTK
jgi:gentisate 1,2-dioxygenase